MTLHLIIQKLLARNSHISRRLTEHHFKPSTSGIRNTALASLFRTTPDPLFDEIVETMTPERQAHFRNNLIWRPSGRLTNRNSPKKFRSRNKLKMEKAYLTSLIRELDVIVYENLPPLPDDSAVISKLLDKLVVLKFNGALGTNLGLSDLKFSIEIRDGLTSLDLTVNQIQSLRSKYGCDIPLLLLNTSETHDETLKLVEKYSRSDINIVNFNLEKLPLDGSVELRSSDHSAMFLSLMESETVDILLSQGKKYILAVDSNNAAAVIDPKTLCYLALRDIDYCMEVAETSSDDLTGRREGKIRLAEISISRSKLMTEKFKLADTRALWANLNAIETLADTDSLKMKNLPASQGNVSVLATL